MIFIYVELRLHCTILNKDLASSRVRNLERCKVLTIMNYKRIHDAIIDRAKNRILTGYKERHHITPRCMGGSNDLENLVDLTAREHFIIHLLLAEIYDTPKLWRAVDMLSNWGRSSARQYCRIKQNLSHSAETKLKMSKPKSKIHCKNMKGPRKHSKQYIEITTNKIGYLNELAEFFNVPASSIHWNTKILRDMKCGLNFQQIGNPPTIEFDKQLKDYKRNYYQNNKTAFGK